MCLKNQPSAVVVRGGRGRGTRRNGRRENTGSQGVERGGRVETPVVPVRDARPVPVRARAKRVGAVVAKLRRVLRARDDAEDRGRTPSRAARDERLLAGATRARVLRGVLGRRERVFAIFGRGRAARTTASSTASPTTTSRARTPPSPLNGIRRAPNVVFQTAARLLLASGTRVDGRGRFSRAENTHKRAGAVALRPDVFLPSQTSLRAISSAAASGKSSSWFFCSKDSRFLVKTCSLKERDVLLDILGEYSKHAETHRGTSLLPQYYGLYTIEVARKARTSSS